jgi:site-specific recombinase XerD
VVLTVDEAPRILLRMDSASRLVAQVLYATGMRIIEALLLRVKAVELNRSVIIVYEAKEAKDQVVM